MGAREEVLSHFLLRQSLHGDADFLEAFDDHGFHFDGLADDPGGFPRAAVGADVDRIEVATGERAGSGLCLADTEGGQCGIVDRWAVVGGPIGFTVTDQSEPGVAPRADARFPFGGVATGRRRGRFR